MSEIALTPLALRQRLSQACELAGGRAEWGRRHGIAASVVSDTINGRRDPSAAVVNAMGLLRVERYIERRPGSNSLAPTAAGAPA